MTDSKKDINAQIDKLQDAQKQYASKDTVISIGGYEFTPAKLMVAFTLVSSLLGGLYGAFEVYKDYIGMKKKIAEYVTPDLSNFDKRLAVIEENSQKGADYTRDIKTDLKNDIRRNETVTEQIERSVKQAQRETDADMKAVQKDVRTAIDRSRDDMDRLKREIEAKQRELDAKLDKMNRDVDNKIQKAIDNPLANK